MEQASRIFVETSVGTFKEMIDQLARLEAKLSLVVTSARSRSKSIFPFAFFVEVDELSFARGILGARESEAIQLASCETDCRIRSDSASSFFESLRSMLRWKARSPWVGMAAAWRVSGCRADCSLSRYAGRSVLGSGSAIEDGSGVDAAEAAAEEEAEDAIGGLEPEALEARASFPVAAIVVSMCVVAANFMLSCSSSSDGEVMVRRMFRQTQHFFLFTKSTFLQWRPNY